MTSILELLQSNVGKTLINGVAQKTGATPDQVSVVLQQAMPLLIGAMQRNAATPQGAQQLSNALEDPRHNGGILDMLGGMLENNENGTSQLLSEGSGILGHILGSKQSNVENAIAQTSGVDSSTVSQILKMGAPILMGLLGKEKQNSNPATNDLSGLFSSFLGNAGGEQSMIEQLLDADGDGSIVDDVAGMVMSGGDKKKGIGGLIGGFFSKS
jgi:hypothetical protein